LGPPLEIIEYTFVTINIETCILFIRNQENEVNLDKVPPNVNHEDLKSGYNEASSKGECESLVPCRYGVSYLEEGMPCDIDEPYIMDIYEDLYSHSIKNITP
jgi:hypothetical protein